MNFKTIKSTGKLDGGNFLGKDMDWALNLYVANTECIQILFEILFLFHCTSNFKLTYVLSVLTNPGMNYILMYILSNQRVNKNKIVTLEL